MSVEAGPDPQHDFGSLQSCFVEGSSEQRARERRIRRRALTISILAQTAILTAIVLVPLFGKPERIAFASVPIPPYFHQNTLQRIQNEQEHIVRRTTTIADPLSPPTRIPDRIPIADPGEAPAPPGISSGNESGVACAACIAIDDSRTQPTPPVEERPQRPRRIVMTHLEPAMLIYRVEPTYPPLAKQIRREGKVELRAIIATDGTIKSLQVVSGDPWFIQSATTAVSQWRYRPTVLNGQPVEIDTFITVFYNLQH